MMGIDKLSDLKLIRDVKNGTSLPKSNIDQKAFSKN
jgi:hypothetical protein